MAGKCFLRYDPMTMITLYQMPISHFCEKIRWTPDYKGIAAKRRNLLPGFHARIARTLAPQTHLPVLEHDGVVIQGSAAIWIGRGTCMRPTAAPQVR